MKNRKLLSIFLALALLLLASAVAALTALA